jgi:glyoxylase-like metal-dependent hydrolase (beta-lactamase superfamily II)
MKGCDSLPTVRVVKTGYLVRKGEIVERSSSTVSLVEAGHHKIVVDTGDIGESEDLPRAFEEIGTPLRAIDMVVNTHLHRDHIGGNELFENARVYAHELEEPPVLAVRVAGEVTLSPGVAIVHTPGHTKGSVSVFVHGRRRYAICGDALPTKGNYDSHTPPSINIDPRLALRSMDAITEWSDVVVPGHDSLFEVVRRNNKA